MFEVLSLFDTAFELRSFESNLILVKFISDVSHSGETNNAPKAKIDAAVKQDADCQVRLALMRGRLVD